MSLFYYFFKTLVGKEVVVELKNDLAIRGTLHSVDQVGVCVCVCLCVCVCACSCVSVSVCPSVCVSCRCCAHARPRIGPPSCNVVCSISATSVLKCHASVSAAVPQHEVERH